MKRVIERFLIGTLMMAAMFAISSCKDDEKGEGKEETVVGKVFYYSNTDHSAGFISVSDSIIDIYSGNCGQYSRDLITGASYPYTMVGSHIIYSVKDKNDVAVSCTLNVQKNEDYFTIIDGGTVYYQSKDPLSSLLGSYKNNHSKCK